MFENSHDEWVAGLDVEYTTVVGREKDLKDEERKKPAVGVKTGGSRVGGPELCV